MTTLKRKQNLANSGQRSYLTSLIKIVGLLLTILTIIVTGRLLYDSMKRPHLAVDLILAYTGFQISIRNNGTTLASKIYVDVLSWPNGVPAADINIHKEIRDLMPNSDFFFEIDLFAHGGKTGSPPNLHRSSSSGYIVVSCSNCDKPGAWAFYIPEETEFFDFTETHLSDNSWPIVEFDCSEDKPRIGQYVTYPREFSHPVLGWYPKKK